MRIVSIVWYCYGRVDVAEARENIGRLYYLLLYRVILHAAFQNRKIVHIFVVTPVTIY